MYLGNIKKIMILIDGTANKFLPLETNSQWSYPIRNHLPRKYHVSGPI